MKLYSGITTYIHLTYGNPAVCASQIKGERIILKCGCFHYEFSIHVKYVNYRVILTTCH